MKFIRSLILFVVVVLAFSCKAKPRVSHFVGLPSNVPVACGARIHEYEMTCVAGGRAYTCVSDRPAGCNSDETINCGVLGAPPPPEDPPQYVPPPDPPPPVTTDNETPLEIERMHRAYHTHPECSDRACFNRQQGCECDDMPMLRPSGVPGTSSGFSWW